MAKQTDTYSKLIQITEPYLGPVAERFVGRQVENHLHKKPTNLTKKDLETLVDWLAISIAHLSDDTKLVSRYKLELDEIIESL